MFIESCAHTDRGLLREKNEDAFLHRPDQRLFAVADGMGGHAAGEVASAIAIRALESISTPASADALAVAAEAANRAVLIAADESPALRGMGSTLTVLSLYGNDAAWAHVGDSRLYLYRAAVLRQLTRDQTWVQQQVDAGALTREQARAHPYSSMLTQALGIDAIVKPERGSIPCYPGDWFLLCSDGLTGMLRDEEIAELLAGTESCEAAVAALIDRANQKGGADNITVVLAAIRNLPEQGNA